MSKAPAYQYYAQDFDMDTASWSNEEVGMYQRLLNYEWVNGGLPDDIEEIARIVREGLPAKGKRYNKQFQRRLCEFDVKMRRNVLKKFSLNESGFLVNSRMEFERIKQRQYIESQREKGIKSSEKRWKDHVTPVKTGLQPDDQPEGNSSSSISINKNIYAFFDKFWSLYPSRKGRKQTKKESLEFFRNTFKEEDEVNLLLKATENYSKSHTVAEGYARDAIRFLKKDFWKDWVEREVRNENSW